MAVSLSWGDKEGVKGGQRSWSSKEEFWRKCSYEEKEFQKFASSLLSVCWILRFTHTGWKSARLYIKNNSVQFSRSDSLRPHELQQARPPCPSPTPGVHSNSRPWSQWCHPAISSSVAPFSTCPQSLPASESFPMSQLFAWGGQSTGVSALASFLPENIQGRSPVETITGKHPIWMGYSAESPGGPCLPNGTEGLLEERGL